MGSAVKSDGGGGVGPALNVRGGIKGHYKYTGIYWGLGEHFISWSDGAKLGQFQDKADCEVWAEL